MLVQPGPDVVVGVGAVVVEDHVDLESLGDLTVNGAQELQELAVAVPGKTLADHHSGQHVQRGEQGRCPVALVPARPFFKGSDGCVRSSAWIWLFSSTHSTTALSGGFR